jgi:hypothetical protein
VDSMPALANRWESIGPAVPALMMPIRVAMSLRRATAFPSCFRELPSMGHRRNDNPQRVCAGDVGQRRRMGHGISGHRQTRTMEFLRPGLPAFGLRLSATDDPVLPVVLSGQRL